MKMIMMMMTILCGIACIIENLIIAIQWDFFKNPLLYDNFAFLPLYPEPSLDVSLGVPSVRLP